MRSILAVAIVGSSLLCASSEARAQEPTRDHPRKDDVRSAVPIVGYTYSADGIPSGTVGARAYGLGLTDPTRPLRLGAGASAFASPVDRLTLIADAARDATGPFQPSFAAILRIIGSGSEGWSVGALGKFKIEGFAAGPTKDEVESEVESGLLLSWAHAGWHVDTNAIIGFGLGDEGEVDAEARARLGRDIGERWRVGVDGQMRLRVAGSAHLPGNRTWDFTGGPQLAFGVGHVLAAVTAGPTTMGTSSPVGFASIVGVGAALF